MLERFLWQRLSSNTKSKVRVKKVIRTKNSAQNLRKEELRGKRRWEIVT